MKATGGKEASTDASGKTIDPTEALQQRIRSLEEERDRLKGELGDVRDRYLRARADYENLVRRSTKDSLDAVRSAKAALLLRVIGVVETFERAVAEVDRTNHETARGLRLVLDDARKVLKDEGIKEIETVGHAFNYQHHQAVERVETLEKAEGIVLETVQRGYLIHGDVLRPALVRVAVPPKKGGSKEESVGKTGTADRTAAPGPA